MGHCYMCFDNEWQITGAWLDWSSLVLERHPCNLVVLSVGGGRV